MKFVEVDGPLFDEPLWTFREFSIATLSEGWPMLCTCGHGGWRHSVWNSCLVCACRFSTSIVPAPLASMWRGRTEEAALIQPAALILPHYSLTVHKLKVARQAAERDAHAFDELIRIAQYEDYLHIAGLVRLAGSFQ